MVIEAVTGRPLFYCVNRIPGVVPVGPTPVGTGTEEPL